MRVCACVCMCDCVLDLYFVNRKTYGIVLLLSLPKIYIYIYFGRLVKNFPAFYWAVQAEIRVYDFVSNSRSFVNSQILTQAYFFSLVLCSRVLVFFSIFGWIYFFLFCQRQTFVKRHLRDSSKNSISAVIDSLIYLQRLKHTHTVLTHSISAQTKIHCVKR